MKIYMETCVFCAFMFKMKVQSMHVDHAFSSFSASHASRMHCCLFHWFLGSVFFVEVHPYMTGFALFGLYCKVVRVPHILIILHILHLNLNPNPYNNPNPDYNILTLTLTFVS